MENCTLLYRAFSSADSGKERIQNSAQGIRNPANYWNPESKLQIQAPLARNPKSKIFWYGLRNSVPWPESRFPTAWNPESKTILKVPYIGGEKSDIHSLLKVHLDFGVVFGTDLIWISVPKEVTPVAFSEAPTASQSCAQISCPDLAQISLWLMVKRAVGDLGTRLTYLFPRPLARGKQRSTCAVHALSKYVGTCGQKRERGM